MIFKHRRPRVESEAETIISKDEFYLTKGLSSEQVDLMDACEALEDEDKLVLRGIIPQFARQRGKESKDIQLRKAQIDPVLMSYLNKRFFIGDKPGLGKTVMSAASYAYYGLMQLQDNLPLGKCIVVTETVHVVKFAKEWQSYGINVVPLVDGTAKIQKALEEFDFDLHDGVVIGWDGLKTNGFIDFYLNHHKQFTYGVFDETSKLLNPNSIMYGVVDSIVNTYKGGLERVIFLNGTSFEKNIYDFYYQFNILQPKLIPTKKFLDDRYVVKATEQVYQRSQSGKAVRRQFGKIVDYKNQDELRERLKYYFIARSIEDFSDDIPKHNYKLHVVNMTQEQELLMDETKNVTILNSPKTTDDTLELTLDTSPKLQALFNHYEETKLDRPIIYVYNIESQKTIAHELSKRGYRVAILNGEMNASEKAETLDAFNNKELDTLVFNVQKAANIPTSDRILFYDIPTMPSHTSQIKARIDRNNYTTLKNYDFFCYYLSPEWVNLSRLGHFREYNSSEFTGQKDYVYASLIEQMNQYIDDETQQGIDKLYKWAEDESKEFKDIEQKVSKLLGVIK